MVLHKLESTVKLHRIINRSINSVVNQGSVFGLLQTEDLYLFAVLYRQGASTAKTNHTITAFQIQKLTCQ